MKRIHGFTLVELMIVIAILAVGITLAVPSFRDLIERKAVGGAAEAAYEQLQIARSQAVKRSKPILVDFNVNGTNWAIGITDKTAGCNAEDAVGTDACTIDYNNDFGGSSDYPVLMRIEGVDYKNITMSQTTGFSGAPRGCTTTNNAQACFDFVRGLARTGEYDFESTNYKLRVEVTLLGNVNLCVPAGEKNIPGYNGC